MNKKTSLFICTQCGETSASWLGKCPHCSAFESLQRLREPIDEIQNIEIKQGNDLTQSPPENFSLNPQDRLQTSIEEIDRVISGGFFPGSVTLFGGHPGIGKSTLALQIFRTIDKSLYFSGEENTPQILHRLKRINNAKDDIEKRIFSTTSLEDIVATIDALSPPFVVIDSIQMIGRENTSFGSVNQIRENTEILIQIAKKRNIAFLLIGHVTKNDEIAGPKVLEHMVDTVLYLEGEKNSEIRILRAIKNRFGSTLELGVFEMQEAGLESLKNPSEFFLSERHPKSFGSVISVVRDGTRNFVLELQVLTLKTNFGQPRRTTHGLDISKFHLLLAVVSRFTPFPCENFDAYLNIVGGMKIYDRSSDLAIIAATLSSRIEKEIPADMIILGEVGLSGEVRRIKNIESRLKEIAKLGFKKVVCPPVPKNTKLPKELSLQPIKHVSELIKICFPS